MRRLRRVGAALTALVAVAALAACGEVSNPNASEQPAGAKLRLNLATKNFTESFIMSEMYKQALEYNGFTIVIRKNVGGTEVLDEKLRSGEIDAYPEYTDLAASAVAGENVQGKSSEETTALVREHYATRGVVVSEETPFENTETVTVKKEFAEANQLRTIGDLSKLPTFTLGARPEFAARQQGFAGLQSVYRLTNATFVPIAVDARFVALDEGDVDASNVFSTDAQLASDDYQVLEDTQRLFGYQHVVLLVNEEMLDSLGGDKFMSVVNAVNSELTQATIQELNGAVDLDQRDPADVARQFLRERGLVKVD
jgi:osmoprotectant transport system substrate-binding protein